MNKKTNFRYYLVGGLIGVAATVATVFSCEKQIFTPQTDTAISDDATRYITEPGAVCGEIMERRVMKNEGKDVGEALIYNDGKYLYVMLSTETGYLKNAYMQMSPKNKAIPMTEAGDPDFTNFNHKLITKKPSNVRKFRIPLKSLAVDKHYLAVAAEFVQNLNNDSQKVHTAWIDGESFGNVNNPVKIFAYTTQKCTTEPTGPNPESPEK